MSISPFGAEAFAAEAQASAAQMAEMQAYQALLADWNTRMNLVGPSALEAFWLRHAWDSAQLLPLAPEAMVWADVGAGAGFPGLVLAILLKGRPGAHVHLIESMTKRCGFLSEVVRRLQLPATVHNLRGEDCDLQGIEVVTARACAPMIRLLSFTERLLSRGASGLFLKGEGASGEVSDAKQAWRFRSTLFPSRSDPSGRIVKVEALSRA